MTDTPRTDKAATTRRVYDQLQEKWLRHNTVDIELARELERELNELKARHKTAILECAQYTTESWAAACKHEEPCAVWIDGPQMTQLMNQLKESKKHD